MANDIKIDKLNAPLILGATLYGAKQPVKAPDKEEGVLVTHQLGGLTQLIKEGDQIPDDHDRVADIKRKIDANEYTVDLNRLSEKLLSNGILR